MATITLTIADAQITRVVDALCFDGGWTADMGVTKNAFAKAQVAELVQRRVREVEAFRAEQAALATVQPPGTVDIT